MLPYQFFAQNLNFALSLLFSLVLFSVGYLYFDAWLTRKKLIGLLKPVGFWLLSLSFLFAAISLEQDFFGNGLLGDNFTTAGASLRFVSYLLIIIAVWREPLMDKPKLAAALPALKLSLLFILPFQCLVIALLYYRKASEGLERHLNKIAFSFFFLSLYEALALSNVLVGVSNIQLSQLVAPFGWVWFLSRIFLFVALIFLSIWLLSYLVKRIQGQLFLVFTTIVVIIFLVVSVSFTVLLFQNMQRQSLDNLEVSSKVFDYALDSKKAEIASVAGLVAANSQVQSATNVKNRSDLQTSLNSIEANKDFSVLIASNSGEVLLRLEEPDRYGDSVSSDPLFADALKSQNGFNLVTKEAVVAPQLVLQASEPIIVNDKVVGVVIVGQALANNFVDSVKAATGLDSSVYADNIRSATSVVASDGKSRLVGVKETNDKVSETVLKDGQIFKGQTNLQNQNYLAVYLPLKNNKGEPVGMVFTGKNQVLVLRDIGSSIETVFIVTIVLLLLSIIPAYLVARYLSRQLQ